MRSSPEYVALPRRGSSEEHVVYEPLLKDEAGSLSLISVIGTDRFIVWCAIAVACSTALSLLLTLTASFTGHGESLHPLATSVGPLRPNPYWFLDKILVNSTRTFPPIVNFPQVVLQLDAGDPSCCVHEDERQKATHFGVVYPDDRHILMTESTSTLVQFRNLDYAMEHCVLNLSLPVKSDRFDPALSVVDSSLVDIWMLEDSEELTFDIHGLVDKAPQRQELLAMLRYSTTRSVQTQEFHCPSGAFTTLELACSPDASTCHVDFWQDRRAKL
ncbi:hypothetical protein PYCCODRAFT_1379207 [Trametes coccinea BRFM310]|uniref:Ubiquitin 3 binding protein But2 C-terminal domain-containing protein n=1 Tax=Trametes coccinea (strain BRFM310) TaxID=1353009 RepID=A0A1Y2I732_TRAC3|nr:hypothetical protein PYCCODRAFT_1379207 [Trametes coccinea BRFM310]